jgi:hypothetical protein
MFLLEKQQALLEIYKQLGKAEKKVKIKPLLIHMMI